MMPFKILRNAKSGAGPDYGALVYAQIMAQGPVNYWRNADTIGSGIMVDEVNSNGIYYGGVGLAITPLYSGGLTVAGDNFSLTGILGFSSATPSSMTSMTLLTIVRPTNLSGLKLLGVQRDENGSYGARFFQWRSSGADMQFLNTGAGGFTLTATSVLAINTTYLLGFEINSSGAYAMYVNGAAVKTGVASAYDYGGAGAPYFLGASAGAYTTLDGRTCENAVFNKVLGPTVHAALFAATGL